MQHAHILTGDVVCFHPWHTRATPTPILWEHFLIYQKSWVSQGLWPLIFPPCTLVSRAEPFACLGSSPFASQAVSSDEGLGQSPAFFSQAWALPHKSPAPGPLSAAPRRVPPATSPSSRCTPSCSFPSPGCWLLQILTPFLLPCRKTERLWCLLPKLTGRHTHFRWMN